MGCSGEYEPRAGPPAHGHRLLHSGSLVAAKSNQFLPSKCIRAAGIVRRNGNPRYGYVHRYHDGGECNGVEPTKCLLPKRDSKASERLRGQLHVHVVRVSRFGQQYPLGVASHNSQ